MRGFVYGGLKEHIVNRHRMILVMYPVPSNSPLRHNSGQNLGILGMHFATKFEKRNESVLEEQDH